MATAKSVEVTNLDTTPRTITEAGNVQGKMRVFADTIAAGTGDIDNDDVIMMAEIPSNAKVNSIKIFNDDLDSGGSPSLTTNVGLYVGQTKFTDTDGSATSYAAGAVIDEDCYASAITTLQAANTAGVELAFEARNVNAIANFAWEDGGLTSDPGVPLRIALTISADAATAAAGDITMVVTYVVD
tara:strand:- start:2474 stop:3028 length:555 start_codon:yes stop_codon:yes gene_type:complete